MELTANGRAPALGMANVICAVKIYVRHSVLMHFKQTTWTEDCIKMLIARKLSPTARKYLRSVKLIFPLRVDGVSGVEA